MNYLGTNTDKSSNEIYEKEINILRKELKSKDLIIKSLLQTIKEINTASVQSIPSCMSSSEANIVPANNSVAIEDFYNNNDETTDTNDEILINNKRNIKDNDIKFMQDQLEEVIREKKEKFYEFKNSDNKKRELIATNNNGEMQGKHPDGTAFIIGDFTLNGIIQEILSRKGRVVKVHNFRGARVDDVIPLLHKDPSFIIIRTGTNDAPYLTSRKILDNLLTLKSFITDNLPNCKVVISTPTLCTDNGKAALIVS